MRVEKLATRPPFLSTLNTKHSQLLLMGKDIPRSFAKHLSGEQIQIPTFTTNAAAIAAGVTAAKFPRRIIHLSLGGTGSVPCLAFSNGTSWMQIAIGSAAI